MNQISRCPLTVDLDRNEIRVGEDPPRQVRPKVAELLHVLAGAWGNRLPYDRICLRLWGAEGGNMRSLQVFVCGARSALDGSGVAIRTVFGRGLELVAVSARPLPRDGDEADRLADDHDRKAEGAGYGAARRHREVAQAYRALAAALRRLGRIAP